MGNSSSSVQAAREPHSLPPAMQSSADSPAVTCSKRSPCRTDKWIAGGKGSWELRFFSLVGQGEADDSGALDDALSRAHSVTGIDLRDKSKYAGLQGT
jgi:hypothetical protein